ncbi:MAG: hypothetical protein ABII64_08790 [Elusimicrobiota bacterium]
MRLPQHALASTIGAAAVYAVTRSPGMAAGVFITGVFIDLDHIIDYWREHPFRMDLDHFFHTCNEYRLKKALLISHSVEFLFPIALLVYLTRSPWIIGMSIGWALHIIMDYEGNKVHGLTYFLFHRIRVGFEIDKVFNIKDGID